MFRRTLLLAASLVLLQGGCAIRPSLEEAPPIVFVHGNGDSAALWQSAVWRFESNGWPRERLHAINVPYPGAPSEDAKPQPGRSTAADNMAFLRNEVQEVLKATGATKVVLVGNSRGGNAIRNYIQNGGGDKTVSKAILGGTPNHGVWAIKGFNEGNEFSGTGPFLTGLNAPKNAQGDEVAPPVQWMTIRSDNNDKFAQPDGLWIGAKGTATNITAEGPALKGATNVVIPRIDHRETSYSPAAFEATYKFITGKAPKFIDVQPESQVMLSGKITGLGVDGSDPKSGNFGNNLPLAGAQLAVYPTDATSGAPAGAAAYRVTVGADGQWGPFNAASGVPYEFVITAPGYAVTHIYRSPFPRSSKYILLQPERIIDADKDAKSIVTFTRPRGYFDAQRDKMSFDGKPALPGVPPSGAGVASSKLKLTTEGARAIAAEFNGERLTGLTWPAAEGNVTILELTY